MKNGNHQNNVQNHPDLKYKGSMSCDVTNNCSGTANTSSMCESPHPVRNCLNKC